jgi:hypothetical protein
VQEKLCGTNYNFSGNCVGVNVISKHSDGQHNMTKNSTWLKCTKLISVPHMFQFKRNKCVHKLQNSFNKTLLDLLHIVGFPFILLVRTALGFCVTGSGEMRKACKSSVALTLN